MATNTSNNKKNKMSEEELREQEIRREVTLLAILALSLFIFIANFGICGLVGNAISGFLFGVIGWSNYIFPIYALLSALYIMANYENKKAFTKVRNKVIYCGVVLIIISMVAQLVHETDFDSVKTLYMDGYSDHAGGGFIGGGLFFIFRNTIGIVGVVLVMLILLAIMFVLITNISIVQAVKDLVERASYEDEDSDAPGKLAKKNLKKERKPRGYVDLSELTVYEDQGLKKPKNFFEEEEMTEVKPTTSKKRATKTVDVFENDGFEVSDSAFGLDPMPSEPATVVNMVDEDDYDPFSDSAFGDMTPEPAVATRTRKPQAVTAADTATEVANVEQQVKTATAPSGKAYNSKKVYKLPSTNLLGKPTKENSANRDANIRATAIKLKNTLENFGVNVTITNYSCGPAVTRYEIQPEQGVKVSRIVNLADDIKLNLAAADIRIEAPIPGKSAVGIEVPNKDNVTVSFGELIRSDAYKNSNATIPFAVGKDIGGQVIVTDIAKMPHVLIAGATGSGKSVCINTLIMSILFHSSPEDVKLIMIDPKMVELACYNGIPHLLIPVVTDPKKASGALNWAVQEMTRRYQQFSEIGVRNIQGYNERVAMAKASGDDLDESQLQKMPYIVVIVDELADLMMVAHGEVEDAIVRLSQLARAAGIHLVIATQRPSVDVITGLIKANVPSRIAFAVSSGIDSRTILDMVGAEKLLGKGDMLFFPTGIPKPTRVQGAFVSDEEVNKVTDFLKKQNGIGTYDETITNAITTTGSAVVNGGGGSASDDGNDEYFVEAGRFIIEKEKASIGMLQRAFKIGFNRAARIMDQLAAAGVVGPEEGTKARKILMTMAEFEDYLSNQ